ncbi:MAG TPA: M15 family metallopeptidase [Longimicrobiaceae bacterium]|nr:M15 family metallopeptidase [Longimicrobiaceae bacterium]
MARSTSALRQLWAPPCSGPFVTRMIVPGVRVTVHQLAWEAVQALGSVLQAHRYPVRAGDTGAYNCRTITGGTGYSLHAYGIAVDVNWNSNPFRRDRLVTDMPPQMIADVYRVRTRQGVPVWRWGGDWDANPNTPNSNYDAMHFEIVASPQELGAGIDWSTVLQPARDPSRPDTWPMVHPGDRGPTVAALQQMLGIPADGIYGPGTGDAVRRYQTLHGLVADGLVGLQSWTSLLTGQPPVGAGVPSPVKLPHP